jgi:hypothetical protein
VAASFLLIPRYGADGAAVAIALALAVPQALKQWGLRRLPVGSTHPAAWRLWIGGGLLLVAGLGLDALLHPVFPVAVLFSMLAWGVLVALIHRDLTLSEVLPVKRFRRASAAARATATPPTSATPPGNDSYLPGTWQCVDWRFLAVSPRLGRVGILAGAAESAALHALGEQVVGEFDAGPVDTVIMASRGSDDTTLPLVRASLVGGGLVKIAVTGPPPGAGIRARLRPLPAWARYATEAGFGVTGAYAALPNLDRTSAFVSMSDRVALRVALRRQPVRPLNRIVGRVAAGAVRIGLGPVVCRQGVVLARKPYPQDGRP